MPKTNGRQKMKKTKFQKKNVPGNGKKPGASHETGDQFRISVLTNSVYYFIQCVFILEDENKYRLLVMHKGSVLTDRVYRTIRGARIAFSKFHGFSAWSPDVIPDWTPFYNPESGWLENKIEMLTPLGD